MNDQEKNVDREDALRRKLEALRREIAAVDPGDRVGRELLEELEADIHALLAPPGATTRASRVQPTTRERWERSVEYFEATHPALTRTLAEMLDLLSGGGL